MSTNLISGLASGFDWRGMVDQLINIDRRRVTIVEKSKSSYQNQLTEWQSLNTKLLSLKTAAGALAKPDTFTNLRGSMTSDNGTVRPADLLTPSMSAEASPGTYTIRVLDTAAAQRLSSASFGSSSEALALSGDILVNGVVVTLNESDSLDTVRTKINNAGAGVMASIVRYEAGDIRLTLTNAATGSAGMSLANGGSADLLTDLGLVEGERVVKNAGDGIDRSDAFTARTSAVGDLLNLTDAQAGTVVINGHNVTIDLAMDSLDDIAAAITAAGVAASVVADDSGEETLYRLAVEKGEEPNTYSDTNFVLETLGMVRGEPAREIAAGRDASIVLDGVTVTRSTNSISDIVEGLTLTLHRADSDTTITINVEHESDTAMAKINAFVESYNAVATYINGQRAYDEDTGKTGGALFGDGTLASVRGDLTNTVLGAIAGVNAEFSLLNYAGITLDDKGLLTVDRAALTEHLDNNFDDIVSLFAARGSTEGADLEFVFAAATAEGGVYDIAIEQAATRGSVTGTVDLSEGLDDDLTLTLTVSGKTATVELTAGMSLNEIIEAINGQTGVTASDDGSGNLVLTHASYGSRASFTLGQSGPGSMGLEDGTYQGLDVAGTINGEAATGRGQVLTGSEGAVQGLSIRYSGDEARELAGTATFTAGVGEQFNRTLASIADPVGGYVAFKRESLGNRIKAQDEQITRINELLSRKSERMINQFVAMETALSKMQSQSDWMAGQINAIYSGWRFN